MYVHTIFLRCNIFFNVSVVSIITFLKNKDYFFRAVLSLQQNWKEVTEISNLSPAPTHA